MAKIVGFDLDKGWFYTACRKCTSKLEPTENGLFCKKCSSVKLDSVPWYKIDAIVENKNGPTIFTAFGDFGTKLIGVPVSTLVNLKTMDLEYFHPLMERIIGQTRTFEISVKKNEFTQGRYHINAHNIFIYIVDKNISSLTSSACDGNVSEITKTHY